MKRSKLLPATLSITDALGASSETPGVGRTIHVSRYRRTLVLAALVALFVSTGLRAQLVNPSSQGFSEARPTQPVITCTAGRAGFIGHAGRQATTAEMVVARGLAQVALGGAIFALAASFRFLGDNVGWFFDPLIPKKIACLRTIPPRDEDFRPFTFEPASEPGAKQEASRFAPPGPAKASTSQAVPVVGIRGSTITPVSAKRADGSTPISSFQLSVNEPETQSQGFFVSARPFKLRNCPISKRTARRGSRVVARRKGA